MALTLPCFDEFPRKLPEFLERRVRVVGVGLVEINVIRL